MKKRLLGSTDIHFTKVGLGTWAIGGPWDWGWGPQDDEALIGTINQAVEKGVNWIDTAPCYGLGHSERVVGREIESVRNGAYSFIFMDVQMPGMDGLEATRKIRELESLNKRPFIIALTANASTNDRHNCIEAGMDDYAAKPVKSPTLELLLDRYIDKDSRSGQESVPSQGIA